MESYDDRLWAKLHDPELMDTICRHVASGGTMVALADTWRLSFGDLSGWVNGDPERLKRYTAAIADRGERAKEVILHELRLMGSVRYLDMINLDGTVKNPTEWPEAIRAAVKSVEYGEAFWQRKTDTGEMRFRTSVPHNEPGWEVGPRPIVKVTFHDKKQAMELAGKNLSLFIERHQVEGKFNLDDFLRQVEGLPGAVRARKEEPND